MTREGRTGRPSPIPLPLLGAAAAGAAVAIGAGVYGSVHDPTGQQTISLFFSSTLAFKSWVTTLVLGLALFQLFTALRVFGRIGIPKEMPEWLGEAHRLSGTIILISTLPVVYHCLWSLGFEPDVTDVRRFTHSVLGCVFYGAFVTKIVAVRNHSLPRWFLPTVGGIVFTVLVGIWMTSSLWYFTTVEFPGF
jgi:hypothetical protein